MTDSAFSPVANAVRAILSGPGSSGMAKSQIFEAIIPGDRDAARAVLDALLVRGEVLVTETHDEIPRVPRFTLRGFGRAWCSTCRGACSNRTDPAQHIGEAVQPKPQRPSAPPLSTRS